VGSIPTPGTYLMRSTAMDHKESKIERYTEKRSLLRRLLESEAEAQTEIANKIFSKIAELLIAGDLLQKRSDCLSEYHLLNY
jgi:hypothetical protein